MQESGLSAHELLESHSGLPRLSLTNSVPPWIFLLLWEHSLMGLWCHFSHHWGVTYRWDPSPGGLCVTSGTHVMELPAQSRWAPEITVGEGACGTRGAPQKTPSPRGGYQAEKLAGASGMQDKDPSGPCNAMRAGCQELAVPDPACTNNFCYRNTNKP